MGRIQAGAAVLAAGIAIALSASPAAAASFSNPAPITINDSPTSCDVANQGPATPYPSPIQVSGLSGTVTGVTATIDGFSHGFTADVRVLLVGPQGQSTDLMDNAGADSSVSGLNITFDDAAASTVPTPPVSGTFQPTQAPLGVNCGFGPTDDYSSPAPGSPYGTNLAGFNGSDPNGTWNLYVVDDATGDDGSISNGWSLDITTASAPTPTPTPTTPAAPSQGQNPSCKKLRTKLKRQKERLARATTDKKRSMIEANIEDTKSRLKRLGC